MPSSALKFLALISGALLTLKHVAATPEPSPKVFALDFNKQVPRNTPKNRLRKRQKTVLTDISNGDIAYIINMTVGTPPQSFGVQLDTGSSDIWIPSVRSDICQQSPDACQGLGAFDDSQSSTFVQIGPDDAFQIQYQDNSGVIGDYFNDTLTFGKTTLNNMTMGLALQATREFGIMGIGYNADESISAVDPEQVYDNIISQLVDQGYINTLAYSLWLNDLNSETGSILFGGVDTAKYHGDLVVLPVQPSSNISYMQFTVALSSVSFIDTTGKTTMSQNNLQLPVILDSGTTLTYLPDSVLNPIISGIGAINSEELGGLVVPCRQACSSATFNFGFGGNGGPSIAVSFAELVIPLYLEDGSQPTLENGETICAFGMASGGPGPYLFGDTFLRSAYVVYDLTNNQVGIAQTNYNATDSNIVEISGSAIPGASSTASGAAVTQTYLGHPQETLPATRKAGSQTGVFPSPTLSLGSCATGSSKNSGKNSAAAVVPPRIDAMTVMTGLICFVSMIFGGSLVVMM